MPNMKTEIRTYTLDELEELVKELGQPRFRAKQLYEWLHIHHASTYDEMTNLPARLRDELKQTHPLEKPTVEDKQISLDGTRKYILTFADGCRVETVGIPSADNRLTVCFSTQVGCPMACAFCATGQEGFTRNLTAEEMVDQIIEVQNDFGTRVSNVVAMGQGEPFLNYDELMKALRILNNQDGLRIGARHITVSTCGILDGIERFSHEPEQFTLAISLHSAVQATRDVIMPRVAKQPLKELKKSLSRYIERTNRRITFEYLLIKNVNDQESDLDALLEFSDGLLCHVNLLPMNQVDDSPYQPSLQKTVEHWMRTLSSHGIEATLRTSRGSDIAGACGQLKNKTRS